MAQKDCPSCGRTGILMGDIERNQTCPTCGGKGTIWYPDPPQPRPSRKKTPTGRGKKPAKRIIKKQPAGKQAKAPTKPVSEKASPEVPNNVKGISAVIGIVAALVAYNHDPSNIGLVIIAGVLSYVISGAVIVLLIRIVDIAYEVLKFALALAVIGFIAFVAISVFGIK